MGRGRARSVLAAVTLLAIAACDARTRPAQTDDALEACLADVDAWPTQVSIDASGCSARVPTRCSDVFASSGGHATAAVDAIATAACDLPAFLTIRLELVDGCPTLLEGRGSDPTMVSPSDSQFLRCIAPVLAKLRLACEPWRTCITFVHSVLP